MHPSLLLSLALALSILLGLSAASAQVIEVTGGASTLYAAQGGTVTIQGERMQTSIGAGLVQHRFAASGSSVRSLRNGTLSAGQQEFRADLPTDVFDASHILFGTGIGTHQRLNGKATLDAFAGTSSQEGGTPLFQTADLHQFTAYGRWQQPFADRCSLVSMGLVSATAAFWQGIQCETSPTVRFAATAGFGGGSPYAAVSVSVKQRRFALQSSYIYAAARLQRGGDGDQPIPEPIHENISAEYHLSRSISLSGLHQNYLTPPSTSLAAGPPAAQPLRSSLDQASLQFSRRYTGWQVSLLHSDAEQPPSGTSALYSARNIALTAGFQHSFGRLQWTETLLHATQKNSASNSLLVSGFSFHLNPHLTLTEAVNETPSGTTFSHGGQWLTTFSSLSVDYQLLYVANRPDRPFQESMVFDASLRLFRGLSLHAASSVGPTGSMLYTFQLGRVFSRDTASTETLSPGNLGAYLLRGRVVDLAGNPVEGAALMVGADRLYTDSEGCFSFRESRARTHSFRVLTAEFLDLGTFVTISAPVHVSTSSQPAILHIVVDHRVEDPSGTPSIQPDSSSSASASAQVLAHP